MTRPTRARAIMLQGTSSHVGKTVLVAGLCRLLAQDGFRVAPFKSQNMSLNAHVAPDGGEMGWAQAMQAEAAGVPARVEMNPILLKPRADAMSQVVVLGKAIRDMPAREYYRHAAWLWPAVRSSYAAIAREADVIVIEGAGSPAEPNLMRRDLANMRVAAMAKAPVLLVGDIDRGGVFASLVGTMAILEPPHRRRVAGFVINKFRGDARLLAPALRDLERRAHRPVLGVVPHVHDLSLPEEDSVALDGPAFPPASEPSAVPTVAIVKLPHIANFTDFAPLESEHGVCVVYAGTSRDLSGAALVVLPGSKDTIADLRWLKSRGLDDALAAHVRRGGALLGICGGYQMLGRMVEDPHGVESGGAEAGLALLPLHTTLEPAKVTQRVKARLLPDGPDFEAYEIHAGTTRVEGDLAPFCIRGGGAPEGAVSADGRVRGTYLHGLLEAGVVRRRVLEWAGALPAAATTARDHRALREAGYDRLAHTLREALDIGAVYRLLGLSSVS
jgi:adenosylcobyric acid synthase